MEQKNDYLKSVLRVPTERTRLWVAGYPEAADVRSDGVSVTIETPLIAYEIDMSRAIVVPINETFQGIGSTAVGAFLKL